MKLLTAKDIKTQYGLPYNKALELIKELNHVQIDRLYYVHEDVIEAFFHPDTPIMVTLNERKGGKTV